MSVRGSRNVEESCGLEKPGVAPPKAEPVVGRETALSGSHNASAASTALTSCAPSCLLSSPCRANPLLRVFRSREIVPRILQFEKAILISKEHSYCLRQERDEVGQLASTIEGFPSASESDLSTTNVSDPASAISNSRRDLQEARDTICRGEDSFGSYRTPELLSMHVDIIREQQVLLHKKDKELNTCRRNNEQVNYCVIMHLRNGDSPNTNVIFFLFFFFFCFVLFCFGVVVLKSLLFDWLQVTLHV